MESAGASQSPLARRTQVRAAKNRKNKDFFEKPRTGSNHSDIVRVATLASPRQGRNRSSRSRSSFEQCREKQYLATDSEAALVDWYRSSDVRYCFRSSGFGTACLSSDSGFGTACFYFRSNSFGTIPQIWPTCYHGQICILLSKRQFRYHSSNMTHLLSWTNIGRQKDNGLEVS